MRYPTKINTTARHVFAMSEPLLISQPARKRYTYPASSPTIERPRITEAQLKLFVKFMLLVCEKKRMNAINAPAIYVMINVPNASVFSGIDFVQMLYNVFDMMIRKSGQVMRHMISHTPDRRNSLYSHLFTLSNCIFSS